MPRNGAGVYSLPPGINPVVVGTPIVDTWANPTLSDVAQAVTDSLDRYGRGGMLAAFGVQDGTVGLPGLAFTNEPTTGLYRAGAGILGLSILATEAARLTATGFSPGTDNTLSLGLATKNWTTTFAKTLSDGAVATGEFVGSASTTARFGYGSAWTIISLATVATERMRIDATGQVGIGVVPDSKFHVQGVGGAGAFSSLRIGYNGIADNYYDAGIHYFRGAGGNSERMRIDASGNVGIGITSIPAKFAVNGGLTITNLTDWNTKANSTFQLTNPAIRFGVGYTAADIVELQGFDISNAAKDIAINRYGGNVGIGATPGSKFHISAAAGTFIQFTDTTNTKQGYINWSNDALIFFRTGPTESMRIDASGNVGIGCTPSAWAAGYRAIELGGAGGSVWGNASTILLGQNQIFTAAGWVRNSIGVTSTYQQSAGIHYFFSDPSGAAGVFTPTERMRIDASGNVGIGTTTTGTKLVVAKSDSNTTFANEVGTVQVQNLSATANNYAGFAFIEANGNYASYVGAKILTHSSASASVVGELTFATKQSGVGGNPVERMHIDSVGIVTPGADNSQAFGSATKRWTTIYGGALSDGTDQLVGSSSTTARFGYGASWANLSFATGGTERLRITSDGRVYGSALHNNAGSMTGTATQYIGSGTYTPTGTTSTNVTGFSGLVGNWIRIGNIVHVSVYGNVTTTASALAASQFYLSLPIASNLAVTGNLVGTYGGGVASANNGSESGTAMADITNDRAQIFFGSCAVGAHQFTATFMYEVL